MERDQKDNKEYIQNTMVEHWKPQAQVGWEEWDTAQTGLATEVQVGAGWCRMVQAVGGCQGGQGSGGPGPQ